MYKCFYYIIIIIIGKSEIIGCWGIKKILILINNDVI